MSIPEDHLGEYDEDGWPTWIRRYFVQIDDHKDGTSWREIGLMMCFHTVTDDSLEACKSEIAWLRKHHPRYGPLRIWDSLREEAVE